MVIGIYAYVIVPLSFTCLTVDNGEAYATVNISLTVSCQSRVYLFAYKLNE